MAERTRFQDQQYRFAAHIRDPDTNPAPENIEDRRMAIYRELFYNNMESFLAKSFPVLRNILPDDRWHALVRDYFATHRAASPLFLEIPQEFLRYLQDERGARDDDPPYLLELAHYEWAELALSVLNVEADLTDVDRDGDLMNGVPIVSPTMWSLAYEYPVHRIRPDFQPDAPGPSPTFLVVYRDLDDHVGFIEINAVTARLLALLADDDALTGTAALARIADELAHPNPDTVIAGGREILERMRRHDVVLGTRNETGESDDG